ncbi:MAG: TonB-dependent receptor [Haliea sp.]|nr:TonB-dependent receptor [Haliea sp.]
MVGSYVKGAAARRPAVNTLLCTLPLAVSAASSLAQDAGRQLEEVVVTAAGYQQRIIDAPASISVISREELRKEAYTTIVDAVRDIPGVYVTGGGNMQDISIRGMDDTYTLYLVDGRPISAGRAVNTNGSDGGKQIGLPPLAMIEQVEVIRGPMSSLYGSEAMGGVINIITRAAPESWTGNIAGDYTLADNDVSNDAYNSDFYLGGPLVDGVLGVEMTGSYQHTDESDFAGGGDAAASEPEAETTRVGGKLNWRIDEANRMGFAYDQADMEFNRTPGKSIPAEDEASGYEYQKKLYTITHDGKYGQLSTSSYLQQDISDRVETEKKEEVLTLNAQANYVGERHIYTFGGRYKEEEFVDETNGLLDASVEGAVDTVDRWIVAVFAEAEWNFIDNLGITTGLRYDDDEQFGGQLSPRIYANWHSTDRLTFKGGISTGYTQPSLANATAGFGRGTGGRGSPNLSPNGDPISRALIIGNPDLEPETSVNYELGFIYDDRKRGLNLGLMAFHTQFKDKIAEDRYCESEGVDRDDYANYTCFFGGNTYYFLSTRKNIAEAEMQGVEASINYWLTDRLQLKADYTFTDSEQKTGEFAGEPLNKMPKQMANLSLSWDASAQVNFWARANYRGETSDYLGRTSMSDGTPEYTLLDLGAVWQLSPRLKLMAGLFNVADKAITNDTYEVVLDGRRLNLSFSLDF